MKYWREGFKYIIRNGIWASSFCLGKVFKAHIVERASELGVDEGRGRASIFEDETIGDKP
jgi:hypothetical protein